LPALKGKIKGVEFLLPFAESRTDSSIKNDAKVHRRFFMAMSMVDYSWNKTILGWHYDVLAT
jgi:hypothetical protein